MDIEEIIRHHEGKTLEFKENSSAKAKILSTAIAFANTSGGDIILGVQDKTRYVIGIEDPHKVAEALANLFHDAIEPRIVPNIEVIPYRNKHLVLIKIYPSSLRPHFERAKGKLKSTYIRIGSTTRQADQDLLNVIERSVTPKAFDEELCYEASCEEIDITTASQFFEPHKKLSQNHLLSLGIFAKDRERLIPTVGGMLLFSSNKLKYFPDAWIQFGVFEGIEKNKIVQTQKITSLLPQAVDETITCIKKNMRIGLSIKDVRHEEIWEIPKIALREAIVNALVHTDYSLRGAPIRIAVFEDRIEIENTALLPWGLTLEDLKSGVSKLRNPVIARVFHELGLIEQWGSGIKRMTHACEEAGLTAPMFEEIGPRIRVTFYKKRVKLTNIDPVDKQILELMKKQGLLSTQEITSAVGLSRRSIITRLARLVDKGLIVEVSQSSTDPKKKYVLADS